MKIIFLITGLAYGGVETLAGSSGYCLMNIYTLCILFWFFYYWGQFGLAGLFLEQ
jgi:hypothetical protein